MSDKKILIAYYSLSGNTKAVAEKIQNLTGGTLYEIVPQKPYPSDYNTVVEVAKQEKQNGVYPELKSSVDVTNYDVIYVGTPVWWYTMAGPVKTFLKTNDFSGKVIAPFCTHGGGGASKTYTDIAEYATGAEIREGLTTYEHTASEADVKNWIAGL